MTGSYDCTAKVWLKESTAVWTQLHVINLHNDSVWDLRLKGQTLVTGGLDGAIGIYTLANRALQVRNFFKVHFRFSHLLSQPLLMHFCTWKVALNLDDQNLFFLEFCIKTIPEVVCIKMKIFCKQGLNEYWLNIQRSELYIFNTRWREFFPRFSFPPPGRATFFKSIFHDVKCSKIKVAQKKGTKIAIWNDITLTAH